MQNFENIKIKGVGSVITEWMEKPNLNQMTLKGTGFKFIDNELQGLRPSQFIVLGGRPGTGKTTFLINLINELNSSLDKDECVLFISLEQTASEITQKLFSMNTFYELKNFYESLNIVEDLKAFNKMGFDRVIENSKCYFVDDPDIRAEHIKNLIVFFEQRTQKKVRAVFIDHIQILSTAKHFSSKYEQTSYISRILKKLALDTSIPVVALSQMSRDWTVSQQRKPKATKKANEKGQQPTPVEKLKAEPPVLTDLRDSGSIEQDADIVLFLYERDIEENKERNDYSMVNLSIAKNRNGCIGKEQEIVFIQPLALMIELTQENQAWIVSAFKNLEKQRKEKENGKQ
ncbi:DnaB-like helicase C-terminal domain-containing protein [Mycoplasma sp. 4079]|uniref:DnaB-like helicase C-terminal domain-containing protein n=1 Tax=Mycoplasma sp. 4079 TaxID=3398615 RepID=UPI0039FB997D